MVQLLDVARDPESFYLDSLSMMVSILVAGFPLRLPKFHLPKRGRREQVMIAVALSFLRRTPVEFSFMSWAGTRSHGLAGQPAWLEK